MELRLLRYFQKFRLSFSFLHADTETEEGARTFCTVGEPFDKTLYQQAASIYEEDNGAIFFEQYRNEVMKELKFTDFISLVILDLDSNRSFQEREMARNKDEMLRIINSRD